MAHIDIDLRQIQITCVQHRLPFNRGVTVPALPEFGQMALIQLANNPSFARGVEAHALEHGLPTGEAIGALLDRAPVCCRLKHHDLFAIYRTLALSLQLWSKHKCSVCGGLEYEAARHPKVEFTDVSGNNDDLGYQGICIRCIAHGG